MLSSSAKNSKALSKTHKKNLHKSHNMAKGLPGKQLFLQEAAPGPAEKPPQKIAGSRPFPPGPAEKPAANAAGRGGGDTMKYPPAYSA